MTRTQCAPSRAKRGTRAASAIQFVVTVFALLAFSLQSYVTQTHIHLAPDGVASYSGGGTASADTQKRFPDRFPANGDPAKCPICQEALHIGQFLTPAAASLLAPTFTASIVPLAVSVAVFAQGASHDWRSRAPPTA